LIMKHVLVCVFIVLPAFLCGCSKEDPTEKYDTIELKTGMSIDSIKQELGNPDS